MRFSTQINSQLQFYTTFWCQNSNCSEQEKLAFIQVHLDLHWKAFENNLFETNTVRKTESLDKNLSFFNRPGRKSIKRFFHACPKSLDTHIQLHYHNTKVKYRFFFSVSTHWTIMSHKLTKEKLSPKQTSVRTFSATNFPIC